RALALDPDNAQIHFNLAVALRHQEKVDEAIPAYQRAVELDPVMAPAWYDLGVMHRANHDNELAVAAFSHYLELVRAKDPKAAAGVAGESGAVGGKPAKKTKGGKTRR